MKNTPLHEACPGSPEMRPPLEVIENDLHDGGSFLPDYDAEVRGIVDMGNPIETKHGVIQRKIVVMSDDTQYDLLSGTPAKVKSDTVVSSGTAWWTHPELEHNMKTVRGALHHGYPVEMVGPPKGFKAQNVSLSKATYDMHRILDKETAVMDVRPDAAIVIGASRAAMMGIGMSVPKYARGRAIPYVDATAPCLPRPFTLKEWPFAVAQLGSEAMSISGVAVEYGKRGQLFEYAKSVLPKDPSHTYNALRIFSGLIIGEAGRMADESDRGTAMHIEQFEDDFWALTPAWENKFRNRDNVKIVERPGTHIGGIAKTKTRRDTNARLERISEIKGFDGSFEDIDFASEVLDVECCTQPKNLISLPPMPTGLFWRRAA